MKEFLLELLCTILLFSTASVLYAQKNDSTRMKEKCPYFITVKHKKQNGKKARTKGYFISRDSVSVMLQKNCTALDDPTQIAVQDIDYIRFRNGKNRKLGAVLGSVSALGLVLLLNSSNRPPPCQGLNCVDGIFDFNGLWTFGGTMVIGGLIGGVIGVPRYRKFKPKKKR